MVDTLTPAQRSERMSKIRSRDTKPEIALRKALHRLGFRFRLHGRKLPGKPDIVLPKYRIALFVHGCFWHRHEACKIATTPKSNTEFWLNKFKRNVTRDASNVLALEEDGWNVIIAWECDLNTSLKVQLKAAQLAAEIRASVEQKTLSKEVVC